LSKKLDKNIKLFCFGYGLTAKYLIKKLSDKKLNFSFVGTSRKKEKPGQNLLYFDQNDFDSNILKEIKTSTHILISSPPPSEEYILKNFLECINASSVEWIGYLSATSVYGNHKGEWVNENSICKATFENGIKRIEAEKKVSKLKNFRIFRLSGIYSDERNIFSRLKNNEVKILDDSNQIFSRVHIEDIAEAIYLSFEKSEIGDVFNLADDYPCSYAEVAQYACDLLKINPPETIKLENIKSEMMKSFYLDKKKVSNKKIKEKLGIKLKFPDYKSGLLSIFNNIY